MDYEEDDDLEPGRTRPDPAHRGVCGKARYAGHDSAKRAMRRMQGRGRGRAFEGRLHPYFCRDCRAWHVGHTHYVGE